MKIAVLSRDKKNYFNKRFIEYVSGCLSTDLQLLFINPMDCKIFIDGYTNELFYKDVLIKDIDIVIPRVDTISYNYTLDILRYFEMKGVKVLNNSDTFVLCQNRFNMLQCLKSINGVKIPKTVLVKKQDELKDAINKVGGLPVILKMGSSLNNALGAILINNMSFAESFLDFNYISSSVAKIDQTFIVQEFVRDSYGKALNFLIIGDKIIKSYMNKRTLLSDNVFDLYSNKAKEEYLDMNYYNEYVMKIKNSFNLDFGTISILKSQKGDFVCEVNPNPDIEEVEQMHDVDVIPRLISYMSFSLVNKV